MDVSEVSAFRAPSPQTPRPGSAWSRVDLMAQAPHSLCTLPPLLSLTQHTIKWCAGLFSRSPGVFYLGPSTLPRPPFPGFLQVPRLLREATRLRAAYPPPGPSLRRERGWTGQAPGAARRSSRTPAPIFDPLGAVPAGLPSGRVTNTNCDLWSEPGQRCGTWRSPTWVEEWSWPAASGGPQ